MKFPDPMALDRALFMLPKCPEREALIDALIDDGGEYGFFPRYQSLKTVGDIRMPNALAMIAAGPSLQEISPETFAWVFAQFDAPEPTPTPAIEDGAGAHALTHDDEPAQLLPILDAICQEGGKSHATFGDRLARLDMPYLKMIRFQDAVAKLVIDANHYDKVGALLREPDVIWVRAKVKTAIAEAKALRGGSPDNPDQDVARQDEHRDASPSGRKSTVTNPTHPASLTSGELYSKSWDNILPPEPPTTERITEEIRQIIHSAAGEKTEVVLGPKRPKTPKGKARTATPDYVPDHYTPGDKGGVENMTPAPRRPKPAKPMGALADVLKVD